MDCKGLFPVKMLKKGRFSQQHFEVPDVGGVASVVFLDSYYDSMLARDVVKRSTISAKPVKDMKSRLLNVGERRRIRETAGDADKEMSSVGHFSDLLDKMLTLNPERRITVREALSHPFLS